MWHDLVIPIGSQSGLKIKLNAAIYSEGVDSLIIDFDSNASVHLRGNGGLSVTAYDEASGRISYGYFGFCR